MNFQNGQSSGQVSIQFQIAPRHLADEHLIATYEPSIRKVCLVMSFCRSMWYYESSRDDQPVIAKLTELAE